MASTTMKPSSSNEGFFQASPTIGNQFYDDPSFQRIIRLFLPQDLRRDITPDLEDFGKQVVSKKILNWVTDAERNFPYLKGGGRDVFGKRTSELVVGEGWRNLQDFGISSGVIASGYEDKFGEHARIVQHLRNVLWTGSCANVTCPSAMTDGAARLLSLHIASKTIDPAARSIFQDAYNRLISQDPAYAWTSGQWMTERKGGSDVSGTETIAVYTPTPEASSLGLGPWSVDGFKWFSSATDSSMSILLAQTPKGLSTFFAPMRRPVSKSSSQKEMNGIYIQRLKNKFGTKSLPTAELELVGTRAFLVGKEGQGIQEISTILNITRLWSAMTAVGYLSRGLAIARAYATVREVGAGKGKRVMLKDNVLHMNTLAKISGDHHSMMLFVFFIAYLMGIEEHPRSSGTASSPTQTKLRPEALQDTSLLLRLLTSVLKAVVCKRSIHALQECMEALGGVGYLDNVENEALNISRLYRDCCVLSIWEGTTDVLCSDTVRVLKGRSGGDVISALGRWVAKGLDNTEGAEKKALRQKWTEVEKLMREGGVDELMPRAREVVFAIGDIIMGILLLADGDSDHDLAMGAITKRFLKDAGIFGGDGATAKSNLKTNQRIVYGSGWDAKGSGLSKL